MPWPSSGTGQVGGRSRRPRTGRRQSARAEREPSGSRPAPPEAARLIYRENNSATSPCKCSASCRVVCPALAGLHRRLVPLSGVHAVDTFSVTEPVTLIHWYVQCGSCPGRRSLLPHRASACWSQPNADDLVGPHVVPLVEGKRRELDRRDVCPGGPTGQHRNDQRMVPSGAGQNPRGAAARPGRGGS